MKNGNSRSIYDGTVHSRRLEQEIVCKSRGMSCLWYLSITNLNYSSELNLKYVYN